MPGAELSKPWGRPRKRDGRIPCAQAKAHAFACEPRQWQVSGDGCIHVLVPDDPARAMCGREMTAPKVVVAVPPWCQECATISIEVDRMAGVRRA